MLSLVRDIVVQTVECYRIVDKQLEISKQLFLGVIFNTFCLVLDKSEVDRVLYHLIVVRCILPLDRGGEKLILVAFDARIHDILENLIQR